MSRLVEMGEEAGNVDVIMNSEMLIVYCVGKSKLE